MVLFTLTYLDVPFYIDSNACFGTIPSEVKALTYLNVFEVDHNTLTGTIPTELKNLTNMAELDLDYN